MLIKIGNSLINPEEIVAVVPDRESFIRMELRRGGSILLEASISEVENAVIAVGMMTEMVGDQRQPELAISNDAADRLRSLYGSGYRFLARDKNNALYAFRRKPEYDGAFWTDPCSADDDTLRIIDDWFAFVSIFDEEPANISSLIVNSFSYS